MKNQLFRAAKQIVIKRPNQPDEILTDKEVEALSIDFNTELITVEIKLKN